MKDIKKHENTNWEHKPNCLNSEGVYYFQNRKNSNIWKVVAFRDCGPLRGISSTSYTDISARKMKNGKPVLVSKQSQLVFIEDILEGRKIRVGRYLVDADPTVTLKSI